MKKATQGILSGWLLGPLIALWAMAEIAPEHLSDWEGQFFPVTTPVMIINEYLDDTGLHFFVHFEKLRSCEYVGIHWYRGAERLALQLEPDSDLAPPSRPTGPQVIGPWFLPVETLAGTHAIVEHRCSGRRVLTHFYPPHEE